MRQILNPFSAYLSRSLAKVLHLRTLKSNLVNPLHDAKTSRECAKQLSIFWRKAGEMAIDLGSSHAVDHAQQKEQS
jgi:hypothetical protein